MLSSSFNLPTGGWKKKKARDPGYERVISFWFVFLVFHARNTAFRSRLRLLDLGSKT